MLLARPTAALLSAAAGYACGLVPSADIATRMALGADADLRSLGSGNPGASNAITVLGRNLGVAVLVADIAKGAAGSSIGRRLGGSAGAQFGGVGAVVGHCFPVTNGFRGGKGVGASVGQCLATFPAYMPIDLAVAAVTASVPWWKRRAFAATSAASVSWVVCSALWWRRGWSNGWGPEPTAALPVGAAVTSAVIMSRFAAARGETATPGGTGEASG